jgi:hypothetical protein
VSYTLRAAHVRTHRPPGREAGGGPAERTLIATVVLADVRSGRADHVGRQVPTGVPLVLPTRVGRSQPGAQLLRRHAEVGCQLVRGPYLGMLPRCTS